MGALPLWVSSIQVVRSDLNGGLLTCLYFIMYQEYYIICILRNTCKPDMALVSIYLEENLSESDSESNCVCLGY